MKEFATVQLGVTGVKKPRFWNGKKIAPYLYLLPAVLMVGTFLLYPVVYSLFISFTRWDGLMPPKFTGYDNYAQLIRDPVFITSLTNTILWVLATLILPVAIGLLLAAGLNRVRGQSVLKSVFYLPYIIAAAAIGIIWSFIYEPGQGVLNTILTLLHLKQLIRSWLVTPWVNTFSMIAAYTWQTMGTNMVLFLVGLQSIPTDPIEASKIDGANGPQVFIHITLPLLKPFIVVVTTMAIVNSFKVFDLIWVMTQGGPYRSSETLAVTMYRESFILFHLGYGAAVSVLLALIVFVSSWLYIRSTLRSENIY